MQGPFDREKYRIVVDSSDERFLKTIQMRSLVCAITVDAHGNTWIATGQDGQFLKIERAGRMLGALGNGMGIEAGTRSARTIARRSSAAPAAP